MVAGLPAAPAQTMWTQVDVLESRTFPALAHDTARGRTVLFGGESATLGPLADTWEWDGTLWTRRQPAVSPPARTRHAMAYDIQRQRVVLFGGADPAGAGVMADTWEWDGTSWLPRTPAASPSARSGHTMAYDLQRGQVVLFGGTSQPLTDTWEWDGASWNRRAPANSPPWMEARTVYDLARRRVVLFGSLGQTWEWDGANWMNLSPAAGPAGRSGCMLAWDAARARTVLFSGGYGTGLFADTWEWDGTGWTERSPAATPPGREAGAMAFDAGRGRIVLFGGWTVAGLASDTWEWDGRAWLQRTGNQAPPPRHGHAMAFDSDRGRTVLFGGRVTGSAAETWEWDGSRWHEHASAHLPSRRFRPAMTYDAVRRRVVLFGGDRGASQNEIGADTWEWDGTDWRERVPSTCPSPRYGHSMTFDSRRGVVVLFGGLAEGSSAALSDLWEWDGVDWAPRVPRTAVPARAEHGLVFDAARGVSVLFGGTTGAGPALGDTCEWDGTDWTVRTTNPMSPRHLHGMACDSLGARVVLFGGVVAGGNSADTWEYDGTGWLQRFPTLRPETRAGLALAFDAARGRIVLFGGQGGTGSRPLGDTWEYGPVHPASYAAFGAGCAGSSGIPTLVPRAGSLPWQGSTFTLALAPVATGSPALLLVGHSRSSWLGLSLPLPLAGIGMPGCTMFTSGEALATFLGAGGTQAVSLAIPTDPILLGSTSYVQALALDPHANAAGVVLSNAGQAWVGAR